ncbi:MAG: hypothetical protein MJY61_03875 [Bacteroidales bacterium]|nr:hypothetical protein [Bacteroidales bacterium]
MKNNRAKISDARTGGNPEARGGYVSPRVDVIGLTSQMGICILAGSIVNNPFGGEEEDW